MRASALAAVATTCTVVAVAAPGNTAPTRDLLLRPAVGIGKVNLGMTLAQVKHAMGPSDQKTSKRLGFSNRSLELTWFSGRADHFVVRLVGRRAAARVVFVATSRSSERTKSGIGPGVTVKRMKRAFPTARCRTLFPIEGGIVIGSEYVVAASGGRETVFVPGKWTGHTANPHEGKLSSENVAEVIVRLRTARDRARVTPC